MKYNPKLTIYFDPRFPNIDPTSFSGSSAKYFREKHQDITEELTKDMPESRNKSVTITEFVDKLHASDMRTRRSHIGYVKFVNRASIIFYSKQQLMV